jgi:type I restriction enzyme S subunit
MKAGWKTVTLGEVCEVLDYKRRPVTKADRRAGPYPYYGATGVQDYVDQFIFDEPLVLLGEDGAKWKSGDRSAFQVNGKTWVNNHAHVIRPSREVIADEWLVFWLNYSDLTEFVTGVTVPKLNQANMLKIPVALPPLAEQKRIVALLDEAFAGIDEAKANAEANLQNAINLFGSHLTDVFKNRGEDWVDQPFEDCIDEVKYTTKIQRKDFRDQGQFPIISQEAEFINGFWDNNDDVFHVTTPVVIFGDHSKVLKYIDFNFILGADGVKILQPKPVFHPKFFFYQIRNIRLKSLGYARHYRLLKEERLTRPSLAKQQTIAARLDSLSVETQLLTQLYGRKIEAQEELKKSLLTQAFAGELTA